MASSRAIKRKVLLGKCGTRAQGKIVFAVSFAAKALQSVRGVSVMENFRTS